ncbi:MAG: SDR family NAD(P)-dependent oxidoreductase, partial [Desulfobacteraceae bacterium]|nr:SDR family NAD(P)-dependent oxidoreductase [Desulfobacteraceae bacterium]
LRPVESVPNPHSREDVFTGLRENGVYLLTGGAGGLGFIFAAHLAKAVHARLVLTGRSPLTDEKASRMKALRKLGAEVVYIQADVTRSEAVKALISRTRSRFGAIHGIFHCAGATRDSLIRNKTAADIQAVIAPKVFGTLHMDEATAADPLDFFVLFSSVSAVTGNPGQCDYAYANGFMDRFAALRENRRREGRRMGRTLSINWPLWRDGGMQVDPQTERFLLESAGMSPIGSGQGLEIFFRCLMDDASQWMAVSGDGDRIRQVLGGQREPFQRGRPDDIPDPPAGERAFLPALRRDVLAIASEILKIDVEDIDWDEDISEYGFDSISFTEFANRINHRLRLNISPAVFFEQPSIRAFSTFLSENHAERLRAHYGPPGAVPPGPLLKPEETPAERKPTAADRFWTPPPLQDREENRDGAIAVIGMAGVMPQSEDLEAFWKHLAAGDDLITEVPESRWDWRRFAADPSIDAGRIKWGGFMPGVDRFDALFFGISPREAALMDPQQRLFMETVWKTIEDAGYRPSDLAGTRTGLFVGVATNDYVELLRENASGIDAFASTGMSHCILANRISFLLDINGPSEPIDTACSSSLVAVHRAVEAMSTGSCEMAIAGGVNVMLTPSLTIAFSKAGMLSADGRCRTFDERADGYVRGEGVGAVLLKPLPRAVADGDHIYGVIRSTAENHGGRAASLTAPNARAQANLLIECYRKAGIDPGTIGYIETHGTGTRLGDPVEINGLKRAFAALYEESGKTAPREPHCGLGAVKSNIGHLETAAGIAGIIKVLLAMRYEQIPASIHCRKVNSYIQLADTPFAIVDRTRPWEPIRGEGDRPLPRRAGISSFGYGGSNAHVILEEHRGRGAAAPTPETDGEPHLFVLSAKNEERLRAYAGKIVRYLKARESATSPPAPGLASIAFTLQVGREAMEERLAAVVTDTDRLRSLLEEFIDGKADIPELVRGNARALKGISGPMVEGRAGAGFVRMLMEDRELDKLGRLWVSGFDVDWRLLYPGKGPGRTPLPTYPFERHRHWIQSKGSAPTRRDAREHGDPERAPDAREADTVECMAFRPVWMDAPPEASAEERAPAGNGSVLLFDVDSGRMEALSRQLRCEVVLVRPGTAYRKQGESVFRIVPDAEAHYQRLVADLSQMGRPPDRVIHLWSRGPEPDPEGGPDAGPASVFFSLFHLCRAIAGGKREDTIRLLYLYPESSGAELPGHKAVSGFAKTLIQENPRLVLKTIAYSAHQDLVPLVSQEFRTTDSLEIRYRNENRQVRRLAELPGDGVDLNHFPVKENGVYLITGGAGGLGFVFAEHLARRVRVDLVLAGRSALDESVQNRMKALEAGGSRVRYIRADITEKEAVDRLIRAVRTQCRRIDGVIHAAGIVRDAFWIHKTVEDAAAVLGPKVTGTRLLDEATREDPLDFFVMFSSAAAVTGNPGQTDYAYANAYMDAYAGYREDLRRRGERFGKTLSVNWPLWRDGGMRVDPETETHLTRTVGMALLNREEGIANFYRGLTGPGSRLVVFKGSRDRILKRLLIRRAGPKDNRPVRLKGDPKADLLHLVADIAGMDEAAVDPAAHLVDYGFASISFTELANRINARFQTEIASTLFLEHPSVDSILGFLKKSLPGLAGPEETDASRGLMPIQKKGSQRPFFCVPGVGGNGHYFYHLSRCLGPEQPFYSFQSLGLHGRTEPHTEVVEMAAYYL